MRAVLAASLALAALAAVASLAPANADTSDSAARVTEGLPLYTSNIRDHGVNCVGAACVNNPNGSIDDRRSYDAMVKAQSAPQR